MNRPPLAMNRRRFVALAAAGVGALAADALAIEPRRLQVTRHVLGPAPAPGAPRVTFLQISDLHLQGVGRLHRRLAAAAARERPGFIVLTGDSVDRRDRLPALDEFMALLDPRTPKYAILGNWEHWAEVPRDELAALYTRHGCRLLVNETARHETPAGAVAITGLDDLAGGRPDVRAALRGVEPAPAHLLLAHCPEFRDRLAHAAAPVELGGSVMSEGVDLARYGIRAMLAGHTHGGQVTAFGWAPLLPAGSGRYVKGWYRDEGEVPMYVSRGVGTSMVPVRFGSVPELAVFTMAL